jgi:hypothetical protein
LNQTHCEGFEGFRGLPSGESGVGEETLRRPRYELAPARQ